MSEDGSEDLKIRNCAYARDVDRRLLDGAGPGLRIEGERDAPPREQVLKRK